MKQPFFLTCLLLHFAVVIAFSSCDSSEKQSLRSRQYSSPDRTYTCDILCDSIDVLRLFPQQYFAFIDDSLVKTEPIIAEMHDCLIQPQLYDKHLVELIDYCNTLSIIYSLVSDYETIDRFDDDMGDEDRTHYAEKMLSVLSQTQIISSDTLREQLNVAYKLIVKAVKSGDMADKATAFDSLGEVFSVVSSSTSYLFSETESLYHTIIFRTDYFSEWDSVLNCRGKSDTIYQQQLLLDMYKAKDDIARSVYALEFAHSDSTCFSFLQGAAILDREMRSGYYSPYLGEMWLTWRASLSTMFGMSSFSYIPNTLYNEMRVLCLTSILQYISDNPDDTFAKANLVMLAAEENISRFGSPVGNSSMIEQMKMFPEWRESSN